MCFRLNISPINHHVIELNTLIARKFILITGKLELFNRVKLFSYVFKD